MEVMACEKAGIGIKGFTIKTIRASVGLKCGVKNWKPKTCLS